MSNLYRQLQRVKDRSNPKSLSKTAAYTITADEASYGGAVLNNTGAGATIIVTLPVAAPGMRVFLATSVARAITIAAGAVIRGTTTDVQTLTSAAAVGNTIQLVAIEPAVWEVVSKQGTWTAA